MKGGLGWGFGWSEAQVSELARVCWQRQGFVKVRSSNNDGNSPESVLFLPCFSSSADRQFFWLLICRFCCLEPALVLFWVLALFSIPPLTTSYRHTYVLRTEPPRMQGSSRPSPLT